MKKIRFTLSIFIAAFFVGSCGEDLVQPKESGTLLFEKSGLVDSAVVYGCYAYTVRYFVPDTLDLNGYSKMRVEFDGYANSDGSRISIIYSTPDTANVFVYEVEDQLQVNKYHSHSFQKPANVIWIELRLYINPPVCGTNEFKYARARDLKVYGLR
ncbi:MAG: hypothetical protein L0Y79_02940 [Chlorobi bacterium]|nr:hypothetical protein [Chlorobiota bacterium]MCI0715082.1 hypothetical protein [Chlorobiota bacterium]